MTLLLDTLSLLLDAPKKVVAISLSSLACKTPCRRRRSREEAGSVESRSKFDLESLSSLPAILASKAPAFQYSYSGRCCVCILRCRREYILYAAAIKSNVGEMFQDMSRMLSRVLASNARSSILTILLMERKSNGVGRASDSPRLLHAFWSLAAPKAVRVERSLSRACGARQ